MSLKLRIEMPPEEEPPFEELSDDVDRILDKFERDINVRDARFERAILEAQELLSKGEG